MSATIEREYFVISGYPIYERLRIFSETKTMNRFSLILGISLCCSLLANAQSNDMIPSVLRSYIGGSDVTYNADKKYLVFKCWNEKETLTETEREELDYLKKYLPKLNVELIELKWSSVEEIEKALAAYNIEVETTPGEAITLKAENFTMNSTCQKVLLVIEDGKPLSVCSGKSCKSNIKQFFKLQTIN